uniref:serine/threonine-protein kinase par-1-like n=1 Tax=Ciona intestinalis TaxID=7719 RepID=UPI000180B0D6|nr:serine/threonine-protein kinase par-1-like [Ciona intestinalis]|eukprot:XP_009860787.2 serine/threonine-protein kinase par-1-like [Ciona intestinalis]
MYCTIASMPTSDLISHNNLHGKLPSQLSHQSNNNMRPENQYISTTISRRLCAEASYAVLGVSGYGSTIPGYGAALQNYVGNMCNAFTSSTTSDNDSSCYVERRTRADKKGNSQNRPKPGFAQKMNPNSVVSDHPSSSSSGREMSPSSAPGSVIVNQGKPINVTSDSKTLPTEKQSRSRCRHRDETLDKTSKVKQAVDQAVQSQYLNWKNSRPWADQPQKQKGSNELQNVQSKIYRFQKTINNALSTRLETRNVNNEAMEVEHHTTLKNSYKSNSLALHSRAKGALASKTNNDSKLFGSNIHNDRSDSKKLVPASAEDTQSKLRFAHANNTTPTSDAINAAKLAKESASKKKSFLEMYEVYGIIGVGGGGMVYSGIRIGDSQPVAIKRIMREKVKRWEKIYGRSVPQEIGLMIRVNGHHGVIKLLDWYECLDSFILVLERPKNSVDLFDYIREVGRMTEKEACMIFRQVVSAVHHIHARGVVHRDIKDENIVLNRDTGESKLIDFGCGTLLHENQYKDFSGTPEFYPPEWFNQHYYKGKTAAIWSMGVLLYDMLCGEIPFKSKQKIGQGKLEFKVSLSSEAKHLISWMLAVNPESRPNINEILQHPWVTLRR